MQTAWNIWLAIVTTCIVALVGIAAFVYVDRENAIETERAARTSKF